MRYKTFKYTLDTIRCGKEAGCKSCPWLLFQYFFTAGCSKKYCS